MLDCGAAVASRMGSLLGNLRKTWACHMTHPKRQRNRSPRESVFSLKGESPCRKTKKKKKNSAYANARTKSGSTKGNSTTPRSYIGSVQSAKLKRKTERINQETNELAAAVPPIARAPQLSLWPCQVIACGQPKHQHQPEKPGHRSQPEQGARRLQLHEEHEDQRDLHRGDRQIGRRVECAQLDIGGADRQAQQNEQCEPDRDGHQPQMNRAGFGLHARPIKYKSGSSTTQTESTKCQ